MTTGEMPGRSTARAHLARLMEMFGTDGLLQVRTTCDPDTAGGTSDAAPGDDQPEDEERS
ncbi:hypothetical protein EES43_06265 [Streptomyces sp. ADI96-02]|uniref:hypothetical protein n=1 Tax=Streptomyces sp. NPDC088729 TaxID=3365876 RepID=UPI000F9AFE7C|nr:hypothetical protein EES43_06265 [Streptomyces sp. ADI96-02]